MTYGTYGTHLPPHPTRQGVVRDVGRIRGVCVHTSEGGESGTSAEALSGFISSPRTSNNLASYHAIADTDRIILEVPDHIVAYAAAGGNNDLLHICIPGKAGQTRDQWLDSNTRAMIRRVAEYICDKAQQYNIPFNRLTITTTRDRVSRGFNGHREVSKAFGQSTHYDPYMNQTSGGNFPWDVLMADINEMTAPAPFPPFDPARGLYSLWPLGPKPSIGAFAVGDVVRYAKGVWRDHIGRYARWYAAHPAYAANYWEQRVSFVHPVTKVFHQNLRRQDLWTLLAVTSERIDPNWDAFDGTLVDSVILTQASFSGVNIEGRQLPNFTVDGIIGPKEMWPFCDSLADGQW
jgi:hypothetical protein